LSPIQLTIEKPSMAGLLISSASTQPPREVSAVAVGVCDSTSSVNKHLQIRFEVLRFPLPWGVANTVGLPRGDRTVMAQDAKATRYHDKDSLFGELRWDAEFPERQPYLYTSQFNIQDRLDPLTDNSHLSTASSLSPSREAVDETKIIKGVSR